MPENESDSDSEDRLDDQYETASITLANLGLNKGNQAGKLMLDEQDEIVAVTPWTFKRLL